MGLVTTLRAYLFSLAGERIVTDLRKSLYDRLVAQDIALFDSRSTGELLNRLSSDTSVLQQAVTVNTSMALRFSVTLIGAMIIMLIKSWKLTLLMLALVPVVVIGAAIYVRWLRKMSRQYQDALAESATRAEESLSGIRTVRRFAREDHERSRYATAIEKAFGLAKERAFYSSAFHGFMSFAGYGAIAGVLWYGARLVNTQELSFGDLTSFLLYTFSMAFSLSALSSLWGDYAKALGASDRVFQLIDSVPKVQGGSLCLDSLEGHLSFDKVQFRYPSRPDQPVLKDFHLELKAGEVVALVGPSGAGKSTVAALISRLYDPDQGQIRLDGRDLRDFDTDWLRQRIGIVAQEPLLFSSTVAENIRYGRLTATDEDIRRAAEVANARDFIEGFPEGFETKVGEKGVRLSGGQKQRVAIARAVLKDPRILILDEATSALDAESEHLVQEALERLEQGRTTLIIAHRLSTVRNADRVVVLEDGQVVQSGSHDELVNEDGLYKKLVSRQFESLV